MAKLFLRDTACSTNGDLPKIGDKAPNFNLIKTDLSNTQLSDYAGSNIILNIFPSIDTSTCAASVRQFNQRASSLQNTKVLCVSRDLPFAQKRFCGAEGIESVDTASDFATGEFGKKYGLEMIDGPLAALHARAIVVIDSNGIVKYTELVPNIVDEPNYNAAIAAV
ncbi:MAG: thiol peroxidase [Crocinitomicaceae bacterium]|jgi:thiol peroxidase|nr:thiol peroxidase [Crocinitomicaceae bacterium]